MATFWLHYWNCHEKNLLHLLSEKPDPGKPNTLRDFFAYVTDPKDQDTSIKVKGCSLGAIATVSFVSSQMGSKGYQCEYSHGAIATMTLNPLHSSGCGK